MYGIGDISMLTQKYCSLVGFLDDTLGDNWSTSRDINLVIVSKIYATQYQFKCNKYTFMLSKLHQ